MARPADTADPEAPLAALPRPHIRILATAAALAMPEEDPEAGPPRAPAATVRPAAVFADPEAFVATASPAAAAADPEASVAPADPPRTPAATAGPAAALAALEAPVATAGPAAAPAADAVPSLATPGPARTSFDPAGGLLGRPLVLWRRLFLGRHILYRIIIERLFLGRLFLRRLLSWCPPPLRVPPPLGAIPRWVALD